MKIFLKHYVVWTLFKYPSFLKINIDFNDGGHWPWETHFSEFQSTNVQSENNFNIRNILK
jgi:hypothetical protein